MREAEWVFCQKLHSRFSIERQFLVENPSEKIILIVYDLSECSHKYHRLCHIQNWSSQINFDASIESTFLAFDCPQLIHAKIHRRNNGRTSSKHLPRRIADANACEFNQIILTNNWKILNDTQTSTHTCRLRHLQFVENAGGVQRQPHEKKAFFIRICALNALGWAGAPRTHAHKYSHM